MNITDPIFGAKGDGIADDSAAINMVFAASKRVHFPEGTYSAATLTISTAGTVITGDQAKIVRRTAGPPITVYGDRSSISGLHLDGATLPGAGIGVNAADVTVEACTIDRTGTDHAIHGFRAGLQPLLATNMTVRRCTVYGHIQTDNSNGLRVDGDPGQLRHAQACRGEDLVG